VKGHSPDGAVPLAEEAVERAGGGDHVGGFEDLGLETPENEAQTLGEEDAEVAIAVAREEPLAGTLDPKKLRIPHPSNYRDSPELPARRIATEWGDQPVGEHVGVPPVLTKFGRAMTMYDMESDDAWIAYTHAIEDMLRAAEVMHTETLHIIYGHGEFEGRAEAVRSIYVVDLKRYEVNSALGVTDWINSDVGTLPMELDLMNAIVPRNLSRFERARRRREKRAIRNARSGQALRQRRWRVLCAYGGSSRARPRSPQFRPHGRIRLGLRQDVVEGDFFRTAFSVAYRLRAEVTESTVVLSGSSDDGTRDAVAAADAFASCV
jgi:hypothetical protein